MASSAIHHAGVASRAPARGSGPKSTPMRLIRTPARHSNVVLSTRTSHVAHAQWFDAGFTQGGRGAVAMPYYSAATAGGPTAGDDQSAIDVDVTTSEEEDGPASPWPQSAASKNSDKWGNFVYFGYVFISAVIMNNILYTFFPNGLASAVVMPTPLKITEVMIQFSCAILAACDFGPQAAKQVRGGLRALDQVGGNRATARDFLGLVLLKIIFDVVGLGAFAVPAALVPDFLPRSLGIAATMFVHSAFVIHCDVTFDAEGAMRPIPGKMRELISSFDRTLAFLACAVALMTDVWVAGISAGLFTAGALFFSAEHLFGFRAGMKKKK